MAKYANIFVDKGASFTEVIYLDNDDGTNYLLTGYLATAKARKHIQSTGSVAFTAVVDTVASTVTISLTKIQTAALDPVTYLYDVIISNATTGSVIKIVEGAMIVSSTMSL